jgi:hypothetical protein
MSKVLIIKSIFPKGFSGIALWPFIVVKNKAFKEDAVFMNHERIHLRQQLEVLVVPFYLWYGVEYLLRLIQYRNSHLAYLNISFEREAYGNEHDKNYLKNRKIWTFTRYLNKKASS